MCFRCMVCTQSYFNEACNHIYWELQQLWSKDPQYIGNCFLAVLNFAVVHIVLFMVLLKRINSHVGEEEITLGCCFQHLITGGMPHLNMTNPCSYC